MMTERITIKNQLQIVDNCNTFIGEKLADAKFPLQINQSDSNTFILTSLSNATYADDHLFAIYKPTIMTREFHSILLHLSQNRNAGKACVSVVGFENVLDIDVVILQGEVSSELEKICALHQLDLVHIKDIIPQLDAPGLIVMDMDSTTIQIECIDEIAKLYDVGDAVSEVTERAMRGELDFAESLRARVMKLKGANESILKTVKDNLPLMAGFEKMLDAFYARGWYVVIASGGFTYFADYLKARFKLHNAHANVLGIENGLLTGEVEGEIVDAQFKADILLKTADLLGLTRTQTIGIGDGANDLPMIHTAALGIAFQAKTSVQAKSKVKINHNDLRAMYVVAYLSKYKIA